MRLSALLLVLALASVLPLTGCDSTGIDPDGVTPPPPPCTTGCVDPDPDPDPDPETMVHLDPRDTFLRTSHDPDAVWPAILPLSDLGLAEGDRACFRATGDYELGNGIRASENEQPLVIATFSASDRLDVPEERYRVLDAVGPDAGLVTPLAAVGDLETDFPEDFDATDACVHVPAGATHVFLGAWDAFYSDNSPVGDEPFGVLIRRD